MRHPLDDSRIDSIEIFSQAAAAMQAEPEELPLWRMKQPLLLVAVVFMGGILLQFHFHPAWKTWLLSALAGSVAWGAFSWRRVRSPWPILPVVTVAAMLVTEGQVRKLEGAAPNHLRQLVLRLPQRVMLRGVVTTDPALRGGDQGEPSVRADFHLRVSQVKFHTAWEPAEGTVQVRLTRRQVLPRDEEEKPTAEGPAHEPSGPFATPAIEFGQEVEVEGVLSEPGPPRNFGGFDHAGYLGRMGILHILKVGGQDPLRILGAPGEGAWIFAARRKLAERLTLGIEDDPLAVDIIRGMLLGYREDIPPDVNDSFRRSGTLHVFAISGTHITLIALSLVVVFRQLRLPRRWACWLVLPILLLYVIATGFRASAVRALVMAGVVIAGWSLQRPSALLNNLAMSALIILVWDPLQLFDAGFQLSFTVVAALVVFVPLVDERVQAWFRPDPYLPRICIPGWRLRVMPFLRWIAGLVSMCIAAWVGCLGLNLYYFNLISLVSLPANLAIVPLASASVGLGLTSLILGAIWSELAITINAAHALVIHAMVGISDGLAGLPHGSFYVAQPAWELVAAGYVALLTVAILWFRGRKLWAAGCGAATLLGGLGLVCGAWMSPEARIDVLDVGGGQCVLISGPRFERVLIDGGGKWQGRVVVEPFLRSRGVNAIDLAIITHGDAAHYGGIGELYAKIPIRAVAVSDVSFRSTGYRRLVAEIERSGIPVRRWEAGDTEGMAAGLLKVLWPSASGKATRADDQGLILELQTRFGSCLFAADAGETIEQQLVTSLLAPGPVLVQGTHSNEDSLSAAFLKALNPVAIVLNSGEHPLAAYPSPKLQERLRQTAARVFRTDQAGGVRILLGRNGVLLQSCLPVQVRDPGY